MANPCALPTALLAISTPPRAKGTPQGLSTPHGNFGDHSAKMPTEPTKQTSPRKLGHLAVRTKNSGPKCLLKCTSRSRSEPHCRSHCTGVYCTGVLLHGCQPGVMPARSHASQESCSRMAFQPIHQAPGALPGHSAHLYYSLVLTSTR